MEENEQGLSESGENTQGEAAPAQAEKDPNKAFAARLGHERSKIKAEYEPYKAAVSRQAQASGMTETEYLQHLSDQALSDEAESQGKTVEQLKAEQEASELKAKVEKIERKEKLTAEEKKLTSDPKIGKWVTDNLADIRSIADQTNVDLNVAMAYVLTQKLPDLLDAANPEKHIKEYIERVKKGQAPIELGGGATRTGEAPVKDFDTAKKNSIEMLKAARG